MEFLLHYCAIPKIVHERGCSVSLRLYVMAEDAAAFLQCWGKVLLTPWEWQSQTWGLVELLN